VLLCFRRARAVTCGFTVVSGSKTIAQRRPSVFHVCIRFDNLHDAHCARCYFRYEHFAVSLALGWLHRSSKDRARTSPLLRCSAARLEDYGVSLEKAVITVAVARGIKAGTRTAFPNCGLIANSRPIGQSDDPNVVAVSDCRAVDDMVVGLLLLSRGRPQTTFLPALAPSVRCPRRCDAAMARAARCRAVSSDS
jgi:hypothetical protein